MVEEVVSASAERGALSQRLGHSTIVLVSLYNIESYSVRTLHATLKRAGFSVTSVFFKRRETDNTYKQYSSSDIDYLISQIKELHPSVVGISVMSAFSDLASEITTKLKEHIDTLVVWGGIHPTIRPDHCLKVADVVCIGEGEGAILELAEKVSKGEDIRSIRNLWVKNKQSIIKNELRPLIHDLDSTPFPDYSSNDKYLIDHNQTIPCDYAEVVRYLGFSFMTSRGCPFSCAYCANSILRDIYRNNGKYIRQRSVYNVIRELEYVKKEYKLDCIRFEDDVFGINTEWLNEFRSQYKESIGLPFTCYGHSGYTTEAAVRILKDAGCIYMQIGVQSGSERIKRDYFKRTDTNQEVVTLAHTLHNLGIGYGVDILMDNPLEAEEDRQKTFGLLLRLPKPFALNTNTLTHFPEYELTKYLLKNNMISENDVEDIRKESFEHNRWNPTLDVRRDKVNMFWNGLYFLASLDSGMSEQFIIRLSHNRLLKGHPKLFLRIILAIYRPKYRVQRISYYAMHPLEIPAMLGRRMGKRPPG